MPVRFDAGTYRHEDITLPRVDAIAAQGADGKLWLEVTNVDPNKPVEIELNVAGRTPKSLSGETLTAPNVDSVNTFDVPNTVMPKTVSTKAQTGKLTLRLDPKSVTVVSLEQ